IVDKPHPDADTPATGADTPHTPSPAKEPALVGAGTHTTTEQAGEHIRLGDSTGHDLGDVGRAGEDAPTTPTVHAGGDLPGTGPGDHLPGGTAGHLPGGRADTAAMLTNSVDTHAPTGTPDHAVPGPRTGDHVPGGPSDGLEHAAPRPADTGLRPGGPGGPIAPSALDHLAGRFGDDAVGDIGHTGDELGDTGKTGDDAGAPPSHTHEGTGTPHETHPPRTAEEQQRIIEEQIHKANTDPDWFKDYYRSDGHRHSVDLVDKNGEPLPVLAKDKHGRWIARDSMPSKQPPPRLKPEPVGTDSLSHAQIDHLNEVAKHRHVAAQLTAAEKALKEHPGDSALQHALDEAQKEYDKHLPGTPNNSAIAERLGEEAARVHVVPEKFPDYKPVNLPKTPNGANMFDQLYRREDGSYLIVEAKAPQSDLIWRQGAGPAQGWMVRQGTSEYVHTIIAEMLTRKGADVRLAQDLLQAWKDGKLDYVLVKANENTGHYAGATLERFPISPKLD
ncbi:hypothetical protein ABZX83_04680, partial [Streptomyces thermoviolaceus]